ncbi:hypothetical protein [Sporosarcina cyprini]|uniref:hypothetical protein n=1 Tax=Sporosarcina cyprini TaxID=2910523 RepID=UPI001EDD29D2|nr:hypothetical protein [Sporosarcina cyprini]MCG3088842.1 hypothetical protein [Sporosarcina cyprini]
MRFGDKIFPSYASGTKTESIGSPVMRAVRRPNRSVPQLYERFVDGFDRFPSYTSGSKKESIGFPVIRAVRRRIRSVRS